MKSRITISKRVGDGERHESCKDDFQKVLKLMMICCEENEPYGPASATANMFAELLCAAYERHCQYNGDETNVKEFTIRITIYHAQSNDYPQSQQEWDGYHGIIIPGSLSAAYDVQIDWIHHLQTIIQNEIHSKQRKTLGICFGHQCFANSFGLSNNNDTNREEKVVNGNGYESKRRGSASKCTIGHMAGTKAFKLTEEGKYLLGITTTATIKDPCAKCLRLDSCCTTNAKEDIQMLYTRGDMVESLPAVGVSLCGNGDTLPNEACAYFSSEEDVKQFREQVKQGQHLSQKCLTNDLVLPYAITFQAHPEYMSSTGYKVNYVNTVKAMEGRGFITHEVSTKAIDDASLNYETLSNDSLDAARLAAGVLGWFK